MKQNNMPTAKQESRPAKRAITNSPTIASVGARMMGIGAEKLVFQLVSNKGRYDEA
jgi:hypothetical protein